MASENEENLAEQIIQFLKKERELYGDFKVSAQEQDAGNGGNKSEQEALKESNSQTEDKTSKKTESVHSEPFKQQSSTKKTSGTEIDKDKTQEQLFGESSDREIYTQIANCKTLDELKALCRQSEELKTDLPDTNLVFGVGNPDADLMLIGEAPGAEEDKQGEPFVGAAGQLLNKILAAIDFEREDVYIANILKHRPPNNRNPKPEERERSLPFLLRQMDLIEPRLILCLGKVAAQTLLDNNNSLKSMRSKFHSFRGQYELMATYHPAALLRHAKWKRPTWEDVQLLRDRYDELGCAP